MLPIYIGLMRMVSILLLIAELVVFGTSIFESHVLPLFVGTILIVIAIFAFCEYLELTVSIENNTRQTELNTALLVKFKLKEDPSLESFVSEHIATEDALVADLGNRVICSKCKSTNLKSNVKCYNCKTKLPQ
jgi:dolichyl-phosphate-mannose--protein O-mannosyl transferase